MSQAERSTKELTLESGVVVTLYEYITGRDKRAIKKPYMEQARITSVNKSHGKEVEKEGTVEIGGVSGNVNDEMEDIAIKLVIKSIKNGDEEITDKAKILDFVLELPEKDFDVVVTAVNEITEPKK